MWIDFKKTCIIKKGKKNADLMSFCLKSQHMLNVPSSGTNTGSETFTPFIYRTVNDILLDTSPNVNQTLLQLIYAVDFHLIHTLLHHPPDPVVDWVQIWTVWWPHVWRDEPWSFPFEQFHGVSCSVCWSAILLENEKLSRNLAHDWQQFVCEKD